MIRIKPDEARHVKPEVAQSINYNTWTMKPYDPPEKILAANLERLMNHYPGLSSEAKVAKAGGTSQRTVNRARNGLQVKLESLQGLSKAFGLSPWQMLVPNLDPLNPPILSLSAAEKALYERLRAAAKQIL